MGGKLFGPCPGPRNLADGGCCLAFFQTQLVAFQAKYCSAKGNRAGGDDQHICDTLGKGSNVIDQRG